MRVLPSDRIPMARGLNPRPKPPSNATRTVTVFWLLAFVLYSADRDIFKGVDTGRVETTNDFMKRYAAWAALYVVLVAGTDFEATRSLSVAFSMVIFISILFIAPSAKDPNKLVGVQVFESFSKMLGTNPVEQTPVDPAWVDKD